MGIVQLPYWTRECNELHTGRPGSALKDVVDESSVKSRKMLRKNLIARVWQVGAWFREDSNFLGKYRDWDRIFPVRGARCPDPCAR